MKHVSVLLEETIALLNVKPNGNYMDGTLGRGGHSKEILKRLENGRLTCFDLDLQAIDETKAILNDERVCYIHDNFAAFDKYFEKTSLDGILLDLGVSSPQFDDGKRGFSYRYDAKLDMRMDQTEPLSAYDIVNGYSKEDLYRILRDYGQEPYAYKIASEIVKKRSEGAIETTFALVEVIKKAYPPKALSKKGHPAKQTFQALRIAVNHELDSLETFLAKFKDFLKPGGRLVIITFHSLEDRLVKKCFQSLTKEEVDKRIYIAPADIKKPEFKLLNRKVIIADDVEINANPRSKSAKLRGIEKEL